MNSRKFQPLEHRIRRCRTRYIIVSRSTQWGTAYTSLLDESVFGVTECSSRSVIVTNSGVANGEGVGQKQASMHSLLQSSATRIPS